MLIFATSMPTGHGDPQAFSDTMAAEVECGRAFYREGLIVQAYMDPTYTRTFMLLDAPSIEAAKARFDTYPQVVAGLIRFEYEALIGMPAVADVHRLDGRPLPDWWPG